MTLPDGLKWLEPGWWLVHVLGVAVVYWYGFKKGREAARKERVGEGEGPAPKP